MSAPDPLRTPQVFRPIPRSPQVNFLTVVDETGTEWCESYDVPRREMREDDEEILAAQIAYDAQLLKQREQQIVAEYKQRIFKNVLDGSIPAGKGKK